jgi:hypothetical protein
MFTYFRNCFPNWNKPLTFSVNRPLVLLSKRNVCCDARAREIHVSCCYQWARTKTPYHSIIKILKLAQFKPILPLKALSHHFSFLQGWVLSALPCGKTSTHRHTGIRTATRPSFRSYNSRQTHHASTAFAHNPHTRHHISVAWQCLTRRFSLNFSNDVLSKFQAKRPLY